MISRAIAKLCCATAVLAGGVFAAQAAPFMIVGNDEKLNWDAAGKVVLSPAGKDSVLIVDLADPLNPKIVANLPLKNSVVGPPVNLDIDPTGSIAIVADSLNVTNDNGTLRKRSPPSSSPRSTAASSRPGSASIRPAIWRWSPIAPTNRSACCRSTAPT
jgi:hypothetical protein